GRIALCRVHNGTISRGQQVAWCRRDGSVERVKITELYLTEALERVPAQTAGPGDIIAVAGIADIMIGSTQADAHDPRPPPPSRSTARCTSRWSGSPSTCRRTTWAR